jgi:hypothetical protein
VPPPLPATGSPSSGRPNCYPDPRASSCQVAGTWAVTYSQPAGVCAFGGQDQSITVIVENGLLCIFGDDDVFTVSADGCVVRAGGGRQSGSAANPFVERWEQVLAISGDSASGTMSYEMRGGATCDVTYHADAHRSDVDGGTRPGG